MPSAGAIGIDFGTTNTVIALAGPDGEAHLVNFPHDNDDAARPPAQARCAAKALVHPAAAASR